MRPPASHPFLEWDGPIAFAHRGGASDKPENTMPAFQHAVDLGYTYLETDVHATRDGVLVAFHDADLSRTCGRPGRIEALPWREVSAARVAGREPIPLFEDLVGAFPDARINVDCKANSALPSLIASLRRLDCLDRVCLGGFSDQRLRRLRAAFGDRLCSSFGPVQMASLRSGARVPFGGQLAQVPVRVGRLAIVTPATVARAHRRGYHVHVWTIDDPDEMTRLLDLGVDGIMTDRPQVLKEVLVARGEWH
ncbi:MAG TPA: glycerophosphodiester phosphodiesterase [Ilumatobacter sp.]|nr:glycerophosphodiester phosphodiesterase [Ilumatobacter sp.]